MVKQGTRKKTSSSHARVDMQSILVYESRVISEMVFKNGQVEGTLDAEELIDTSKWRDSPDIALANLRTLDSDGTVTMQPLQGLCIEEKTCMDFLRRHGAPLMGNIEIDGEAFDESFSDFLRAQFLLRKAWKGGNEAITDIEGYVEEGIQVDSVQVGWENIELKASSLWAFICVLFLRHEASGKLGFCNNPDCAAPYYLKKRRTQKFCESGPCTRFAKQKYALKWWHENKGKELSPRGPKKGTDKK